MLHLVLLVLDEIRSGKFAVKWGMIYGDDERAELESIASRQQLLAEGKGKATHCPRQEGLEGCSSWSDHSR